MRLFKSVVTTVTCLLYFVVAANAHSTSRQPLNYLTLIEDPRIQTHNQRITAHSSFHLTFDLHKHAQHIRLSLEPNYDILGEDSVVKILDRNGNIKSEEKINRFDHKVYQGQAYTVDKDGSNTHVGWARVVVVRDGVHPIFEGAFTIMGDHHHIQMKSNYLSAKHAMDPRLEDSDDEYMVVYRDSDVGRLSHTELRKRMESRSCVADTLPFNNNPEHPIFKDMLKRDEGVWGTASMSNLFGKRQSIDGGGAGNGNSAGVNLRNTIGDTTGCPKSRQVALVGVAADCNYVADFNSTESVRANIINVVNIASDLFQSTFNITLGLRNLTLIQDACPGTASTATPWNVGCQSNTDINQRLNLFSSWKSGLQDDVNAYWSLFTTCNTGAEVGLAWLGQLCNHASTQQGQGSNSQTVTAANVVARTATTEWQVFAHESGHTFGAVHDCDATKCANSQAVSASECCPLSQSACDANAQYLMNPYSSSDISRFSPCSIGNVCSALGRNSVNSQCLTDNRGVSTITGQQCGNGIVEEGEECDCGGTNGCAGNACCNPTTCKFNSGAVCDPTNEGCCTSQCQFSAAGTVCRASTGVCDPQETCTGNNATCPFDKTNPDGSDCGNGLRCASGQCTSRDQQCKTVMGVYTQGNDTFACDSQGCVISCGSPEFGAVCYRMQQNFLDGTDCGGGGHCQNGVCRGSTAGGEIRSWINDNKTLVIALASSIGGLILLAILGCIFRACRRKRSGHRRRKHAPPSRPNQGWNGPPIPPNMTDRGYGHSAQHTPSFYPQQPPQAYGGHGGYGPTGSSVRYA